MVSIVIPTLNSAATLGLCLDSILAQDYARGDYEIVVADAGSTDATLEIAKSKGVDVICANPLKTGEAGKTAGVEAARGEIIALIDSDNILPDTDWLSRMVVPFADADIIASEPWEFTVRPQDAVLTRYFALLGMNDPVCLFTGNYDRRCGITGRWTGLNPRSEDCGDYLKIYLTEDALPTIGANGFVFRRTLLDGTNWKPYLFDIDVVHQATVAGRGVVAKVKTGIVHLYCARFGDFVRKQRRRIRDFLFFSQEKQRTYPWNRQRKAGIVLFCLASATVLPLAVQMLIGILRRPDRAWLYHVPVCWVTLWVYGIGTLRRVLGVKQAPVDRSAWQK